MTNSWQFWIDRGGTFTDLVALAPDGRLVTHKLLSSSPNYSDAALRGIKEVLDREGVAAPPAVVRMGTTVGTNALLERKGARTLLATTRGFGDQIRIAYQNRPHIFALNITLPEMLYEEVIEIEERIGAHGEIVRALDEDAAAESLITAYDRGFRSLAIVLMHAYRYPSHEQRLQALAKAIGFEQISTSHETVPLPKFVSRGDTTLADAYLSPILRDYIGSLKKQLGQTRLFFMQSNGGLAEAEFFRGKDSILSGPAGGIIGAIKTAASLGEKKIITFDMGGTSTDVAHYAGNLERCDETLISGSRIRAPMLAIHTVAAGGGSILKYDAGRFRVGPASAGALPGPACYGNGGPLTITDCNVLLGRIQPHHFPNVFGSTGDKPLDAEIVSRLFDEMTAKINLDAETAMTSIQVASGFLSVAIEKMANAIKQVSTQKGYNPADYTLFCFGGAGGQHACLIAESLGIKRVLIHKFSGVLSAYGMGLADVTVVKEVAAEVPLTDGFIAKLKPAIARAMDSASKDVLEQTRGESHGNKPEILIQADVRYKETDFALRVPSCDSAAQLQKAFSEAHYLRYGFAPAEGELVIDKYLVASTLQATHSATKQDEPTIAMPTESSVGRTEHKSAAFDMSNHHDVKATFGNSTSTVPLYELSCLPAGTIIHGPAIIAEPNSTIVCEHGWELEKLPDGSILLRSNSCDKPHDITRWQGSESKAHPLLLELFNNLFMFVAEQMGTTLQNTSYSVNIKERLDFSCAIFDEHGELVANAPHIPVHLGSMGESVKQLISRVGSEICPGDVYALNDPYHGGTHLPDVTVMTPYFATTDEHGTGQPLFYFASRGHHADIGGITPGSMPPQSRNIEEEGVLFDLLKIVDRGIFLEQVVTEHLLNSSKYPARNPIQNIADLKAQIAANHKGLVEFQSVIARYGLHTTRSYMQFVQDNAERCVRELLANLPEHGEHESLMDCGAVIRVKISIDKSKSKATIDFNGSSPQMLNNYNAPESVCKAAVMYVFRTLLEADIPLNAGCLRPLDINIPAESILSPCPPAAVVAGNVETSQIIVDTLYAALGVSAAAQGTMNNLTFGNSQHQYYETIAGGAGATATSNGASAVQTHMTNSRMTDPEILELRLPVRVEQFAIRVGSGGSGKFAGGNGVVRKLRFLETMDASILSNRRRIPPFGLKGGLNALPGRNLLERRDGRIEELAYAATVSVSEGDCIIIETPGGGGYGRR